MTEQMTGHAGIVKSLHKAMRDKFKNGVSEDIVWDELIQNKEALKEYSQSMYSLASSTWKMDNNNRIKWCEKIISNYFDGGGLKKSLRKELKTQYFRNLNNEGVIETKETHTDINSKVEEIIKAFYYVHILDKKVMLDVGSCFNPFSNNSDLHTIAVDIAPATDDVIFCDFLNLLTVNNNKGVYKDLFSIKEDLSRGCISGCVFDIVTFSLLLSYFPSARQRLQCCLNAQKCLKMNGLLLIVTPDSSHQNKHVGMMKSWKNALESIGFTRFKYDKLDHLHCMAYRKSKQTEITLSLIESLRDSFFIPQDSQEIQEAPGENNEAVTEYDSTVFADFDL